MTQIKIYGVIMNYSRYPYCFDDHLVVILWMPLVDKSSAMNAYKAYYLPIDSILQKASQYCLEGE